MVAIGACDREVLGDFSLNQARGKIGGDSSDGAEGFYDGPERLGEALAEFGGLFSG